MPVYVIRCYDDIVSISKLFPTKKQIVAIKFSKLFDIYIPILLKHLLPEELKF